MAWRGDLIVFVAPGVGHLTNLDLPGENISSPNMGHGTASRTRRMVWKDLEIMEANENKPKVSGFYCIDQLNLLRYCGIKVNGSKEKPSRFLQVQLISVGLTFAAITV